jgi:hypothetical protein
MDSRDDKSPSEAKKLAEPVIGSATRWLMRAMIATYDYAATSTTREPNILQIKAKRPPRRNRSGHGAGHHEGNRRFRRARRVASCANKVSLDVVGIQVCEMRIVEGYGLAVAKIDNDSGGGLCHMLERIVAPHAGID